MRIETIRGPRRWMLFALAAGMALMAPEVRDGRPAQASADRQAAAAGVPPDSLASAEALPRGKGIWYTARRLYDEVMADRVLSVAGGLTFFGLLAALPAITALVSAFGLFADPAQVVTALSGLTALLPPEAAAILVDQAESVASADDTSLSLTALAALVLALWSATGGTKALIEALNVAYGVRDSRGFLRLNLLALGLTVGGVLFALALILSVAALPLVLEHLWLGPMTETLLLWGRWPAILVVVLLVLAVIYRFAPNRPGAEWRWISPGAVLAAVGLIGFSLGFAWYAAHFASYNRTYGSLGAVIALMTWMWLSGVIVLTGAELNSELDRQTMNAGRKGPAARPKAATG